MRKEIAHHRWQIYPKVLVRQQVQASRAVRGVVVIHPCIVKVDHCQLDDDRVTEGIKRNQGRTYRSQSRKIDRRKASKTQT